MSTLPGHDPLDPQDATPNQEEADLFAGTVAADAGLSAERVSDPGSAGWTVRTPP